jgi:hypothetical protein
MPILDGLGHRCDELEPPAQARAGLPAVDVQWPPFHVFHDDAGPAGRVRAAVEKPGDAGMAQPGQDPSLAPVQGVERAALTGARPQQQLGGVHPAGDGKQHDDPAGVAWGTRSATSRWYDER